MDARFGDRRSRRIRIFRNRKTNFKKHVRDYYIENGVAYISCNVKDYYDIIDPHSVEGYEWLNHSFVRFVEENANYIPPEYPILLEICGAYFTKKQEERIEHAIREYYALKLGEAQDEVAETRRKIWILLIGGIVVLSLLVLLSKIINVNGTYLTEILFIFFWFCIWEAGDLFFYDRDELLYTKTITAQLESMKIEFSRRFVDTTLDDEEAKQIIEEVFSKAEEYEEENEEDEE